MSSIDEHWNIVLHGGGPELSRIAARASREPALRCLFPYASLNRLTFSRTATYWVEPDGDRYQLRDAGNAPLVAGTLDEVIEALVRVLAMPDPAPDRFVGTTVSATVTGIERHGVTAEYRDNGAVLALVVDAPPDHGLAVGQPIQVAIARRTVLGQYAAAFATTTTLILGDENDDSLREVLKEVLDGLGASLLRKDWGVGGSQVVETYELAIDGERVVVEAETYVGLSISGPWSLVRRVGDALLERYKQLGLKIFLSPA